MARCEYAENFPPQDIAPSEMADVPTQREMTSKAFDKIAEGLNEALAIARGTAAPARLHVSAEMDVRAIRAKRIERTSRG